MKFHYYHKISGLIHPRTVSTNLADRNLAEKFARGNAPYDHEIIEGSFDHLSEKIEVATKNPIAHVPDQPSVGHEWHIDTKRWRLKESEQMRLQEIQAAREKITLLQTEVQPKVLRKLALGDESQREELKKIEDEIVALESLINAG